MTDDDRKNLIPETGSVSNINLMKEKIFSEKISLLNKNLPLSLISVIILSTLIYIGLYQSFLFAQIKFWYISVIIITLFRAVLFGFYNYFPHNIKMHRLLFIIGSTCSAALWGLLGSYFMIPDNYPFQMIIIVILAGSSAGGMQTLQASLTASLIFIISMILPLCIWLYIQNDMEYNILCIAMFLYLGFMILTAIRGNRLLTKMLNLQYENKFLVDGLIVSNQTLKLHENDLILINKMNETLQLCQNPEEAYSAIKLTAQKLFSTINGGLTITNINNIQELVLFWGDVQILLSAFASSQCWAYRSANQYVVSDGQNALMCQHYNHTPEGSYICIPLLVNTQVIGILNFNLPPSLSMTNYMEEIIISFSNAIKLSIEKNKMLQTLQEQSIHDPLTHLYNRRFLDEALARELKRVFRDKSSLCVAMLDLDHFKTFNDRFGHAAGDKVLECIGSYLSQSHRDGDIACRFGGEEFVLIYSNTNISKIIPRIEQIRTDIKNLMIKYNDTTLPSITISIGIAEAPKHGATSEEILRAADKALYSAKETGRDKVEQAHYES
jgi:diguanylate cyclase (GGDEF)-like protein